MEIIVADWETYYTKDYSLSRITTEEYIRDPQFQAIMLGLRMPDGERRIITGTHEEIKWQLASIDWGRYAVLCHNAQFDAAIFTWIFGVKPKLWLDTLSMARFMFGNKGNSLKALAEYYNLPPKGTEVLAAMGKRREDFTDLEFGEYSGYCLNDCDLTLAIFELMMAGWYNLEAVDKRDPFPHLQLKLIDATIRMFSEPRLVLDAPKLVAHLETVRARKTALLENAKVDKADLMSNQKFADLLSNLGVVPPTKISPTTGNEAFAFAKTDEGMKELLEHTNPDVQALAAARMGVKSTLEETRTERFIAIAGRGKLPVPLKYAYAISSRWSGGDKINLQNLPARGINGNTIKSCIMAPEGYVIIDCDSSNIEARSLAWWACQDDLVEDFRNKQDVYSKMASTIYGKPVNRKRVEMVDGVATYPDHLMGFVGKTVILGAGYGTGGLKLQATLKASNPPVILDEEECKGIINTYRATYPMIQRLWKQADKALQAIHDDQFMWLGREGVVAVEGRKGIKLPSGKYIKYNQLHRTKKDGRDQWVYKGDYGLTGIHGAKLVENVNQGLACIIVGEQLLKIKKRLPVVMTVHDAVASIAKKEYAKEAQAYVEECMRFVPEWAAGCPIDCESGMGLTYGDC